MSKNEQRVDPPSHLSAPQAHHSQCECWSRAMAW